MKRDVSFDSIYTKKLGMFGSPYKELQDYFRLYPRGSVLDIGCGQGRDSLFFGSLGFHVVGVDSSQVGVDQMVREAEKHGYDVVGLVGDALSIEVKGTFDVILFDMLLYSFEREEQLSLLRRFVKVLRKDGIICIVFPDDLKRDHFTQMLDELPQGWTLLDEVRILDVPSIDGEVSDYIFTMLVVQFH